MGGVVSEWEEVGVSHMCLLFPGGDSAHGVCSHDQQFTYRIHIFLGLSNGELRGKHLNSVKLLHLSKIEL